MPSVVLDAPLESLPNDDPPTIARAMRLLVVDDSELDRQRMLRLCTRAGLRFTAAEAGTLAEMATALDEQSFDLVFIDYVLAGDTGLDALDLLVSHPDQTAAAAIMIAGEGQIDIAVDAIRKGCSDYLTKSQTSVEILQKSIATALERRMLSAIIDQECAARFKLEQSIQEYARSCTAGMRTVLSATHKRVRTLRRYETDKPENHARDLGFLESDIDRLWDALPDFRNGVIAAVRQPHLLQSVELNDAR